MASRVQHYRAELKKRRGEWEPYLKANSGFPGPRANLELVTAVGEEADADLLWRLSASSDEFLALSGTAGLGGPLVQRAAAAGLCEPALLKKPDEVRRVLMVLDHITRSMAATRDRKHEGFKVLRQAMGYCWSVAAAANPAAARPLFVKWLRSADPDIAWVMKTNLGKARLKGFRKGLEASKIPSPRKGRGLGRRGVKHEGDTTA